MNKGGGIRQVEPIASSEIGEDSPKLIRLRHFLSKVLHKLGHYGLGLCMLSLLIIALYVSLGRQLMPFIEGQRDRLEDMLSDSLGIDVSIGSLQGDWQLFSPVVILENIEVSYAPDLDTTISRSHLIGSLRLDFDIPESFKQRKIVVKGVSVSDLKITIIEDELNKWNVAGFGVGQSDSRETLVDFIIDTKRIELNEANIILQKADNSEIRLNNLYFSLGNFTNKHQVQAQFRMFQQADPLRFQLELTGDPRDGFNGTGFFRIDHLDMSPLLDFIFTGQNSAQVNGSALIWFEVENNNLYELHANLTEVSVLDKLLDEQLEINLSSGSLDVSVSKQTDDKWQLWFENLEFDWYNGPWQSEDFFATLDMSNNNALLEVSLLELDVNMIRGMIEDTKLTGTSFDLLNDLSPSGKLNNIVFATDLLGIYPDGFKLRANLEDIEVGAWSAAPSMQGIYGYVETSQVAGFVELDTLGSGGFDIHLPELFEDDWHYDGVNTRVNWRIGEKLIVVNSSIIDVVNDDISARVQFELNNLKKDNNDWETSLSLLVGILDFDASKKSIYLPILENIETTMQWLDQSLVSGELSDSGFLFQGVTSENANPDGITIQSFYHVDNVLLDFLPGWPALEKTSAFIFVDKENAEVQILGGELPGIVLDPSFASIENNLANGQTWLTVEASAQTTANTGLDFVRNTPIRDSLGAFMDNWSANGEIEVNLNLGVSLNDDEIENEVDLSIISNQSSLEIPDFGLNISAIQGQINYSSFIGLNAEGVSAVLLGSPINVNIESFDNLLPGSMLRESGTIITGAGSVSSLALQDADGLANFVKDVLSFSEGEINYQAQLLINDAETPGSIKSSLSIRSDLQGLAFSLPPPFNKESGESRALALDVDFLEENKILTGRYSDDFYTQVQFTDDEIDWGLLYFGMLNQDFEIRQSSSTELGVLVSGSLDYFNYDDWSEVALSFYDDEEDSDIANKIRLIDVDVARLVVFGQELTDINTQVSYENAAWNVFVESEEMRGLLEFPDNEDVPVEINFDYLAFFETPEDIETEGVQVSPTTNDILEDIDPNDLPNINFNAKDFSIGERNLGDWAFALRRNSSGVSLSNFFIEMEGASVTNYTENLGADLEWLYIDGQHTTHFEGIVNIENLAQVLPNWGYEAMLESENARFVSNLEWKGSPAAFSLTTSSGNVDVSVADGRFINFDPGGARLFGALNFDSIVRRLQLDFSDLYETGFAYDEIAGRIQLVEGVVTSDGVFLIDAPSSIINIEGEIDLVNETINTDLLVSIPISQNIAVVAGIIGAWPVAIGTYIMGKVFRDQFAGLTAVRYHLEGPWDELNTGFEPAESEDIIEVFDE